MNKGRNTKRSSGTHVMLPSMPQRFYNKMQYRRDIAITDCEIIDQYVPLDGRQEYFERTGEII